MKSNYNYPAGVSNSDIDKHFGEEKEIKTKRRPYPKAVLEYYRNKRKLRNQNIQH